MTWMTLSPDTQQAISNAIALGPGENNLNYWAAYNSIASDLASHGNFNAGTTYITGSRKPGRSTRSFSAPALPALTYGTIPKLPHRAKERCFRTAIFRQCPTRSQVPCLISSVTIISSLATIPTIVQIFRRFGLFKTTPEQAWLKRQSYIRDQTWTTPFLAVRYLRERR
jgi:hypothetical protein